MIQRVKMKTDPWDEISSPDSPVLAARRAEANHPFGFFWARDLEGHCLLLFQYDDAVKLEDHRPKLKEIEIVEYLSSPQKAQFALKLKRNENRDIFHQLCLDIINSTRNCKDEKSALATLLRRTWRWRGMLRDRKDERLAPEEQKGLIGELRVLELAMLTAFKATDALDSWLGPSGGTKDFSAGNVAIEAKAKRGSSRPYIKISSEHQLEKQPHDKLFLAVTYTDEVTADMPDSMTVADHVDRVGKLIEQSGPGGIDYFEGRLSEAGFYQEHDYSDYHWITGETLWFQVKDNFPRIATSDLSDGIRDVSYNINLASCKQWEVSLETVTDALIGKDNEPGT